MQHTALGSLLSFLMLAGTARAGAQPLFVPPSRAPRATVVVGVALNPSLTLSVQYLRPVASASARSGAFVGGGITLPTTALSHHAWRTGLTAVAYHSRELGLAVAGQATAYVAHNRNDAGSMLGVGTELRGTGGRRGPNAFWGLELGWQETLATRIAHSAATRATFRDRYPPGVTGDSLPDDGWYRDPARRFRAGALLERRTGARGGGFQLALGGTVIRQRQHQFVAFDLAQIPFYLESAVRFSP